MDHEETGYSNDDNGRREPSAIEIDPTQDKRWDELEAVGKAVVYENRNWKNRTYVLLCNEQEARPFFPDAKEGTRFELKRCGGLVSGANVHVQGWTTQRLWVKTDANASVAFPVLAHEAFHAASFALRERQIPLDMRGIGASQCLSYYVDDFLQETLPPLEKLLGVSGADLPRKGTRRDRLVRRAAKDRVLAKMSELGISFLHEDKTWKACITTVMGNVEDIKDSLSLALRANLDEMSETSGFAMVSTVSSQALVWADPSQGARKAFASLAQGAVSAAGCILANCGVDVDVSRTGASECVAYFIEHFLENIQPWFLARFAGTLKVPGPGAAE